MNILIIEDNIYEAVSLSDTLKHILSDPCDIHHTENLEDGLAILDNPDDDIDLVFLDLKLPDTEDWRDVRAQISPYTKRTPFIVISGDKNKKAEQKLLHEGAEDYIVKGSPKRNSDMLRDAINHALCRHKAVERMADKIEEKRQVVDMLTGGYSVN